LIEQGEGSSSSGSDSEPSEDNLQAEELIKNLPTIDKTLKKKLKEEKDVKKEQLQEKEKNNVNQLRR